MLKAWNNYWHNNEILSARVDFFRILFFSLLGIDIWLHMIPHAPRLSFGEFNVAHFLFLDKILPTPNAYLYTILYIIAGYLAIMIAFNVRTKSFTIILTIIYSLCYFWSQLDSYQHHYLIALILLLSCFIPFATKDNPKVKSWAFRLMYLQISILYFYTATTKVHPYWADGWALEQIVTIPWQRAVLQSLANTLYTNVFTIYAIISITIMLWQYLVCLSFIFPKLRKLACVTGPIFHILIEVIALKIEFFSYYMMLLYYVLLIPDDWFIFLSKPILKFIDKSKKIIQTEFKFNKIFTLAVIITSAFIYLNLPFNYNYLIAFIVSLFGVYALISVFNNNNNKIFLPLSHLFSTAILLIIIFPGSVAYDYYRFWGGDLTRRNELRSAVKMYERANSLKPNSLARHFNLGEIYLLLGDKEKAKLEFIEGLKYSPNSKRGLNGLKAAND